MRILALSLVLVSVLGYQFRSKATSQTPVNCQPQATGVVLQSTDNGNTWQDLSYGLPEGIVARCASIHDDQIYIGTEKGKVHHRHIATMSQWESSSVGNPFLSIDGLTPEPDIMSIHKAKSGAFAVVYRQGFYQQNASNWEPIHPRFKIENIYGIQETDNGVQYVQTQTGLYKSKDKGSNWQHIYSKSTVHAFLIQGNVIVASVREGIVRSLDGGDSWTTILPDEGAVYTLSTLNGNIAAVRTAWPWRSCNDNGADITKRDIALRVSNDAGATWQPLQVEQTDTGDIFDVAQVGSTLYYSHKGGISRSTNGGKTWTLTQPIPIDLDQLLWRYELFTSGEAVYAVLRWNGC
jgi:photosystem II stability/assembly factor-like uncharacterized protein